MKAEYNINTEYSRKTQELKLNFGLMEAEVETVNVAACRPTPTHLGGQVNLLNNNTGFNTVETH